MSSERKFNQLVDDAVAQSITGWDFSYVQGRIVEAEPSWSYRNLVEQQLLQATALLDMCTGGGEFLDSFERLPESTYATEGYPPNIAVAKKCLEKRGVKVIEVTADDNLPLASHTFDLVINRHGAYAPAELLRVMQPSYSTFLTQQVGSDNAIGLNEVLGGPPATHSNWQLDTAVAGLVSQGLAVTRSEEEYPVMSFKDIGAVVFYLQAIPWQILDFSVAKYRAKLMTLHEQIEATGSFETRNHRFLIQAELI